MGLLQHVDLLDYQTVRLAFDCETDTRHAATLDTGLVASQVGVAPTCLQLISSTHVQSLVRRFRSKLHGFERDCIRIRAEHYLEVP